MIAKATPTPAGVPGWVRQAVPWVVTVLAGLAGAWLALAVAGTSRAEVGPLGVEAGITPAWGGETVVEVDPVGTLVVDTHDAPLQVRVAVRTVDVAGVQDIVANPTSLSGLDERVVDDLQGALVKAAVRSGVVAVVGAVIVGGLLLRSWQRGLIAGAVALAAVASAYGLAALTFDPEATREPRFTGLLSLAPQLVGSAEAIASNFDAYADQLASIVTNVSRLYDTTLALPTFAPDDETIRLLHVSDLHLNPGAWELIDAVAEQYDVDAIVDTGDIADHGTAPESAYVRPIADLGRPYVFVKGNHDSVLTAAAVAEAPNAVVLDGSPVEVAGLKFLGAPDPRFTPDQTTRGTADEDIRAASEELADEAEITATRLPTSWCSTTRPMPSSSTAQRPWCSRDMPTTGRPSSWRRAPGSWCRAPPAVPGCEPSKARSRRRSPCRFSTWTPRPGNWWRGMTSPSAGSGSPARRSSGIRPTRATARTGRRTRPRRHQPRHPAPRSPPP